MLFSLTGNPLEEKHTAEGDWRDRAVKVLPNLKKLDGKYCITNVLQYMKNLFPKPLSSAPTCNSFASVAPVAAE